MSLPKVRNSYALVLALAAVFAVQFIWFEWIVPSRTAGACSWAETGLNPTNVLLVADPQLIDNHTYPGRNSALLKLLQHTVDKYVAQNYKAMVGKLQPDYIFFLGDYLDNGRLATDQYFNHEVRRFWRIFDRWPGKYVHGKNWFTNVPGNHDIGFGNAVKAHLRQRFEGVFGLANTVVEAGGVEFVMVDTPLYSADNGLEADARHFVNSLDVGKLTSENDQATGESNTRRAEDAGEDAGEDVGGISESVDPITGKAIDDTKAASEEKPETDLTGLGSASDGSAKAPEVEAANAAAPYNEKSSEKSALDLETELNAPNPPPEKPKSQQDDLPKAAVPESSSGSTESPSTEDIPAVLTRKPRILLSHVPLYRDTKVQTCGPLRESLVFHQNKGYQYQLALLPEVSSEILEKLRPIVAFSGDDHDYCDVTHPLTNTREITVKSISMAMGIWQPAVQLLSFDASSATPELLTYDTHLCYLPTPYHNVIAYAITAAIIGAILLSHALRLRPSRYNYNYSILPTHAHDYAELSAILMENPMSRKVSNFLKEQDEGSSSISSTPLPAYTSTAAKLAPEKVAAKLKYSKLAVRRFMRKWNLVFFLRLCLVEFFSVMLAYFVVVTTI